MSIAVLLGVLVALAVLSEMIFGVRRLIAGWFARATNPAPLALMLGAGLGVIALAWILGLRSSDPQVEQIAIVFLIVGLLIVLVVPFKWRDSRRAARGQSPVEHALPPQLGVVGRLVASVVALGSLGALVLVLGDVVWSDLYDLAFIFLFGGGAGYGALTGRMPQWLLLLFGSAQAKRKDGEAAG